MLAPERALAIGSAESESGDTSIEATGYARVTGAFMHFRDLPAGLPDDDDGLASAVLRLLLTGELTEQLSYETNLFMDLSRTPGAALGGSFATAGSFASPYRAPQLSWSFWDRGAMTGKLGVDRLKLELDADPVLLGVGRFPVNYSVTNIFTPNDFFAPFGATAVNTIFKPGVDALRFGVALDELSSIEVVRVMGYRADDEPSWPESALLGRANTVLWGFEWAAIGGKLAERWVAGASLQGELGPLMLRGEGHAAISDADGDGDVGEPAFGAAQRDDVSARIAGGLDMSFSWQNAVIGAEYAFLSDGAASPDDYLLRAYELYPDDLFYLGRHYAGVMAGAEIIPILRATATALMNLQDASGLASIALAYDIADEAAFSAGLLVPWGERPSAAPPPALPSPTTVRLNSELGMWPLVAFLESRFYF